MLMSSSYVREERELSKPELSRRGFEFFRYRDLPAHFRAADVHIHDAIEFVYLRAGSVIVNVDDREERLLPGDLTMFRSRGIHTMRTEECEVNSYYTLKIRPKLIADISPKNLAAGFSFRFSAYSDNHKFIWRGKELEGSDILKGLSSLIEEYKSPSELSDLNMLISVITLLRGILTEDKAGEGESQVIDKMYESIMYINTHFSEDITAEGIAEKMNMSYSAFARAFKRSTGKNFKEYLNMTRTNQAEQLLASTDMSVTDVATHCGYNNISYFISIYKRYKGKTPLAERKN